MPYLHGLHLGVLQIPFVPSGFLVGVDIPIPFTRSQKSESLKSLLMHFVFEILDEASESTTNTSVPNPGKGPSPALRTHIFQNPHIVPPGHRRTFASAFAVLRNVVVEDLPPKPHPRISCSAAPFVHLRPERLLYDVLDERRSLQHLEYHFPQAPGSSRSLAREMTFPMIRPGPMSHSLRFLRCCVGRRFLADGGLERLVDDGLWASRRWKAGNLVRDLRPRCHCRARSSSSVGS